MRPAPIAWALGLTFAASIGLSSIHPWGNLRASTRENPPLLAGSTLPADVRQVLEMKCADCHSESTRWPIYSRLAPASWLIERDVHRGREQLNLSRWQEIDRDGQIDLLTEIAAEARSGEMPLKQYVLLHPDKRLSAAEQELLYRWAKSERKRVKAQQHDGPSGP